MFDRLKMAEKPESKLSGKETNLGKESKGDLGKESKTEKVGGSKTDGRKTNSKTENYMVINEHKKNKLVVAAIDFGTTYSGIYCFFVCLDCPPSVRLSIRLCVDQFHVMFSWRQRSEA